MRVLWATVLAAGCAPAAGPLDGGAGGGGGTAAMCVFSGGKVGSVGCGFQSATFTSANNRTVIVVGSTAGASITVTASFNIASSPGMATYSGGIADTECTIDVQEGARHWGASTVMSVGACAVNIRTVKVISDSGGVKTYELRGGLSASVEPDDGMGGSVSLTSSF